MKRFLLFSGLFLLGFTGTFAQATTATPAPVEPIVVSRPNRATQARDMQAPMTNLALTPDGLAMRMMILQSSVQPLYRKPTREELQTIAPSSGLLQKFNGFLRADNTGLFKLLVDVGCADNTNIVVAKEKCLKFTMPGAGNSYSFRTNNYRIRHLADLTFSGKNFYVSGVLMHGIMVNIGDVPLENVTLQTNGLKFLNEFQPTDDFEQAKLLDRQFVNGVTKDGFFYSRGLASVENTTYILRSIAYDGRIMRSVRGIAYNELDFDKRKDVMIAFRVVSRDADGSLTILWKELSRKDAPKFKKKFPDRSTKIKENKFVAKN
ncbi:MAG: hypothetical protein WA584_21785 [Pyrinomonadaceae bacterium]